MDSLLWVERRWSQGTCSQRWSSWAPEEDALPPLYLHLCLPSSMATGRYLGSCLDLNIGSKYSRSTF